MRAIAMVCNNREEINQAQALGMREIPKPVLISVPFVFHLQSITWAYLIDGPDNVKVIKVVITGQEITMEYEEALWSKIDAFIGG
jgi:hypothetical protein